jgi:hypothetical protein
MSTAYLGGLCGRHPNFTIQGMIKTQFAAPVAGLLLLLGGFAIAQKPVENVPRENTRILPPPNG